MSKLDRQLDQIYGEERVVVRWPSDEEIDIEALRKFLISEIDSHVQRIPLDLRAVEGAPPELIELLIECQVYARSNGKVISVSTAGLEMQSALNGRPRRRPPKSTHGTAGDYASSILNKRLQDGDSAAYDGSMVKKIKRPKKRRRKRRDNGRKHYVMLAVVVALVTALIGAVEWYVVFYQQPDTVIPFKGFEVPENPDTSTTLRVDGD